MKLGALIAVLLIALHADDFEKFQAEFRSLTDSGRLNAAEAALMEAQQAGLDQLHGATYERFQNELTERREQAMHLIEEGDDFLRAEHFKEARERYEQAGKIDRDNSLVANKIAMAKRFEHEARVRVVRELVNFAIPVATQTLTEYFELKREQEERRKAEEERREREEAARAAAEERNRDRRHVRR